MFLILSILLAAAVTGLLFKIQILHQAVDEIRIQFAERMETDTNVGIDTVCSDKKIKQLAADLDRQLKLLRQKQIQYTRGDQELKTAVTNISHDLRTPLTAIYGYLRLLEKEEMSETAAQYFAIIQNRVDALKTLAEERRGPDLLFQPGGKSGFGPCGIFIRPFLYRRERTRFDRARLVDRADADRRDERNNNSGI